MRPVLPVLGVLFLSACAGTASPSPAPTDAGLLLRLAPPVGQVSRYQVTSESSMAMEGVPMMGSGLEFGQTMFLTNTVTEESGDQRTVSSVIDSVKVDAPEMMSMLAGPLRQMKGARMELVMTTRGDYVGFEVDESTVTGNLAAALGSMQESLGGFSLGLPEEPVRQGVSWTVPIDRTVTMAGMGEMVQTGEMSFVFEGTEEREDGRHAILSFTGVHNQGTGADPSASVAMEMDVSGESTGELDLSLSAGRIHGMTMTMTMGGVVFVMGNEVSMSSTTTLTQSLLGGGDDR